MNLRRVVLRFWRRIWSIFISEDVGDVKRYEIYSNIFKEIVVLSCEQSRRF